MSKWAGENRGESNAPPGVWWMCKAVCEQRATINKPGCPSASSLPTWSGSVRPQLGAHPL